MDANEAFDELDEQLWTQMRQAGVSEQIILQAKRSKQWKEDVYLYNQMIKQKAWEFDPSCTFTGSYLKLCSALEGLNRRHDAITKLTEAHNRRPGDTKIILAVAKLLFKDDQKDLSLALCREIFRMFDMQRDTSSHSDPKLVSEEDAADAYYLGGWIKIHDDDHTEAYKIWQEGHIAVPNNDLLVTQYRKRACWDEDWNGVSDHVSHLVGSAPFIDANDFDISRNVDAFTCWDPNQNRRRVHFCNEEPFLTPALGIFHPQQKELGVVFRTKLPVLTAQECQHVIDVVNHYHDALHGGVWGTVRHSSVKTTDVAVESIPILREWLLELMYTRLHSMLGALFPRLADGTTLYDEHAPEKSRIRIHDAFIVRYDAEKDLSLSLPEHCDTSAISVIVSLNSEEAGHYCGGGTWFEALGEKGVVVNAEVGQAVAFAGPLKHAGYPTTKGVRVILVLFLYVQDYHYGPHLSRAKAACSSPVNQQAWDDAEDLDCLCEEEKGSVSPCCHMGVSGKEHVNKLSDKLASGGEKGGFVVYKQTVDLVNMLEKSVHVDEM